MKRFHAATVALAAAFVVAGLSARAEDITAAVRSAGKATITVARGRATKSLASAFDGKNGWAAAYCLLTASDEGFTPPSEENPIIVDYVIADDFRPGEDIIVSRFVVYGVNQGNKGMDTSAAKWYEIYGSNDGETWHKLVENRPLAEHSKEYGNKFLSPAGSNAYNNFIVPWKNRASYRRYRFKFTANGGYTGTDRGQLCIQDIQIHSDKIIYVAPDGSNDADGLSWATATTPTNAVRLANAAAYTEIHCKAGHYTLPASCVYTKRVIQIGGFAGDDSDPLAMDPAGARSVYDGGGTVGYGFQDNTTAGNYLFGQFDHVENMEFCNMSAAGLYLSGSQGIECRNCRFVANRKTTGARGVYLNGQQQSNTSNSRHLFYDCDVSGNGVISGNVTLSSELYGCGIYDSNGRLYAEDCSFTSNGVPSDVEAWTGANSYCIQGSVVYCNKSSFNSTRCYFLRNRGFGGKNGNNNMSGGGCVNITGASGIRTVAIVCNCAFVGNEDIYTTKAVGSTYGGFVLSCGASYTGLVENCTFAYNTSDGTTASAGMTVVNGTMVVSNSVFYGNRVGTSATVGADVGVQASGKLFAGHTLFSSSASVTATSAANLNLGDGVIYGDPLFVSSADDFAACLATSGRLHFDPAKWAESLALDVHLTTPAGYRKNGSDEWFTDALLASPAIDAGDPASDFSNEPTPNGGRVNQGAYGNTAEASKTPAAATFEILPVPVQFFDGVNPCEPVPALADKESGAALDPSDFEFSYVDNAAYGTAVLTATGRPGTSCAGESASASFRIAARFRVTALSLDTEGDGQSWSSPMSLTNAIAAAVRKEDEILVKAGTYAVSDTISVPNPLTIRGGYAGTAGDAMAAEPETVLDGGGTLAVTIMSVTAATESTDVTTVENFAFTRSARRGFAKSGATSLRLLNCRFDSNRLDATSDWNGIGAYIAGTVGQTEVTMSNCVVRANQDIKSAWKSVYGHGVYAANLAALKLIDTTFVSNGIAPSSSYSTTAAFAGNVRGFALYASAAPVVAQGCDFRLNRGYSHYPDGTRYTHGGIVWVEGSASGTAFDHCLFAGNITCNGGGDNGPGNVDGTLFLNLGSTSQTASINHCTFFGNIADTVGGTAGVHFRSGAFTLANSVFAGNVVGSYATSGADLHLAAGTLSVANCLFGGEGVRWVSAADGATITMPGETGNVIYGDPRTVTPIENILSSIAGSGEKSFPSTPSPLYFGLSATNLAAVLAFDAHLLSGSGYRKNGSAEWFTDTTHVSAAIDAADYDAPYGLEPDPNGSRANIGRYGNTPEASKSATGSPEIPAQVDITYPDGYSQPQVAFSLGGDGVFSATVMVGVYTNGNVLVDTHTFYGATLGDRIEYMPPMYLPTGTEMSVMIVAVAAGGSSQRSVDATVTAPMPPWYGKGGPANVIHVRSGATGLATGENWTDAYPDFHTALKAVTPEKNEIWFAGTNVCVDPYATIALPAATAVRGGFAGVENSTAERTAGTKSVVDGRTTVNTMDVSSDYPLSVERITFRSSRGPGVSKTGSGNLSLADCEIEGCGFRLTGGVYGYGLAVEGAAGVTLVTATNCVFAGNGLPPASMGYGSRNSAGYGFGAALRNLARATLDDCLFVTNGIPFSNQANNTDGYQNAAGSAIYASSAPVTARRCRFVCNRAWSSTTSGGTVRIVTTSGESAFTNCLWLANQNSVQGTGRDNNGGGGEIYFAPGSASASCEIVNCTFAANLEDIWSNGGAGLNVRSGEMRVLNSIFYGNLMPRRKSGTGMDVYVASGAVARVSYTFFSEDSTNALHAADGGVLARGAGLLFGNPGFASTVEDVRYMYGFGTTSVAFPPAAIGKLLGLNVHLRGRAGYVDETRNVRVCASGAQSRAIDAGDPASDFAREPSRSWGYHGRRVNLGFYGNTPYATATPYQGMVIYVGPGGARVERPAPPDALPTETISGGSGGEPLPLEDIIVCDQADQAIKIYRGTEVVWRWAGGEDTTIPAGDRSGFSGNVAECKIVKNGTAVAMAANGGRWAVVGLAETNVLAWGKSSGWPHSIELLPNDIVAVAATDTSNPANKGVYLYDVSGSRAKSPNSQNRTKFAMDNPHGLYWDATLGRMFVSDTQGLHMCRVGYDGTTFSLDVERTWLIAPLGLTYAHDLMPVPGSRLLAMTTYEQIVFFDIDALDWRKDLTIWRMDAKCFDPHRDGVHFLVTVPKAGFSPTWCTDTIETYSADESFRQYLVIPGAKLYKARWAR
ncbi:MAG: right-handed parallel beta-helix repeat-containing protein [Kiritimatiellae bacterium]|nr:right-handed parallel beta-helix repeat-containing protein [Kiritimatiellia bacterium]